MSLFCVAVHCHVSVLCGWSAPGASSGRLEGEEEQKEEQKEVKSEVSKKEGEPSTSRVTGGDEEVSKETIDRLSQEYGDCS